MGQVLRAVTAGSIATTIRLRSGTSFSATRQRSILSIVQSAPSRSSTDSPKRNRQLRDRIALLAEQAVGPVRLLDRIEVDQNALLKPGDHTILVVQAADPDLRAVGQGEVAVLSVLRQFSARKAFGADVL